MTKPDLTSEQIESCKEGVKIHTEKLSMASQSYDKAILSLSTAALGYIFLFVKFIINNSYIHACFISFVCFFLILSILFVLISFVVEQLHSAHRIKYYYWCLTGKSSNSSDKKQKNWTDTWMILLSILSGGCYLISIILFSIFVGINL